MNEPSSVPVTLYPKRSSAIWLLLVCGAFVILGIWLVFRGEWFGFVCAGFFGLGIPLAIVKILPGSTFLQVDATGITYASLFRKTSLPWSAFDEFCVVTIKQTGVKVHEMVGFDFAPTYDHSKIGRRLSRVIAGCEGGLPDTYGMKAADLAAMLTSWLHAARTRGRVS